MEDGLVAFRDLDRAEAGRRRDTRDLPFGPRKS